MVDGSAAAQVSLARRPGAFAVVVDDRPVGIDLEHDAAVGDSDLDALIFHPDERAAIALHPGDDRALLRTRLWTAKEAMLKLDGRGLNVEPASLNLPLAATTARGAAVDGATVLTVPVGSDHSCSLAVSGTIDRTHVVQRDRGDVLARMSGLH